ncbi:hypothetical protein C8R32_1025 [Nitrosospira sp. Nsp5]|uniref:Secreted protein with PEP-CTERM sorting signal n=2 Tax=Nitrosomonadaceae TaxID=206379 RepID=A0ABY0TLD1_9PROT|nr:hypothetical protein C8R32_1025 [Nitrosospira sp. Nsp5]SDQ35799.1 hypothetical protein SAMN05216402_0540 [Nitrosospira multiformis]SDR01332.1 hypothetical protein SAMN05216402_3250 [Nitrosospira multiformis]
MSLQTLKPALIGLMLTMIGLPFSTSVQAHGGLSLADDICKLTIGPFTMHFTGYQPEATQEKEFCEDIPATGRTVVALDYIEEALRPLPTEVRIIRDTGAQAGAEGNLDAITILHIPAKVYPNGSINFEYDFMQPGKFVGLVTVRDKEEYVSRFPFSVGEPKGTSPYLIVAIAALIGAAAVFFLRGRQKSTPA